MEPRTRLALAASIVGLFSLVSQGACNDYAPAPHYAEVDRGADTDGDGIADADDACPEQAEDGLPPKANDGCPADDSDNDGIVAALDKCPYAKEDGLPPDPGDGCPANDADGDGVADARDKCPAALEDNLPPYPSDGCPSGDADRDGIVDALDRCPSQPETWNGYRDEDGCPDTPPAAKVVYDDQSSSIYVPASQKIEFKPDSAELGPEALGSVAAVADVLRQTPAITRIEIEGHASSKGDAAYNLGLTDRRSQAIARALVSKGVDPKRLVPVGYGELCPAVELGDDVDDARNRRVVVKVVVMNGVWQTVQRGCWKAKTKGIDPTQRRPLGAGGGASPQVVVTPGGA
jgi:outer membrane protein OmpA-like peptidoglycan-associated protein